VSHQLLAALFFYCDEFFLDRVLRTISPGWLGTVTLLIPTSRVGEITGLTNRHMTFLFLSNPTCPKREKKEGECKATQTHR
jgi:hypothetical protein